MSIKMEGCVKPAGGPIGAPNANEATEPSTQEVTSVLAPLVGKPAPDFEASGYFNGEFEDFKLSDFRGKWTVLCFYPGDFTFV